MHMDVKCMRATNAYVHDGQQILMYVDNKFKCSQIGKTKSMEKIVIESLRSFLIFNFFNFLL
jgi:hypothetical protein